MSRARGAQRKHTMDPVTLVNMARLEPAAAQYILDRRRRGIPARGQVRTA